MKLYKILFEQVESGLSFITKNGDQLPHHVSLTKFKPYHDSTKLGNIYDLQVTGLVVDKDVEKKVAAVSVELPEEIQITTGSPAHITVGLFEGGKPVNSQKLDYAKAIPLSMTVKVMLVNTTDNNTFMETYQQNLESVKANTSKGNAQLVLSSDSSVALKNAVLANMPTTPAPTVSA